MTLKLEIRAIIDSRYQVNDSYNLYYLASMLKDKMKKALLFHFLMVDKTKNIAENPCGHSSTLLGIKV